MGNWSTPNHSHRKRAFTLIEVAFGATILVVGLVGMMHAITLGSEMLDTARKQQIAVHLIEAELERIRSLPWDDSDSTADELCIRDLPNRTSANPLAATGYLAEVATGFVITRNVTNWKSSTTGRVITITVTWSNIRGRTVTRSGTGYFAKSGWQQSYQTS